MAPDHDRSGEKTEATASKSVDELEADLQHSRAQLAETVDALTAKLDVKARAGEQLADTRDRAKVALHDGAAATKQALAQGRDAATDGDGKPTPQVSIAAVALVAAVVLAVVLWRRRR